jgi:hypothetical protein
MAMPEHPTMRDQDEYGRCAMLRAVVIPALWLPLLLMFMLPSLTLAAGNLSPKDFDMACAMTTGAEMGVNAEGSEKRGAAFTLFVFYLGRLSGRDDGTDWNKAVLGRVAELKEKARSDGLFKSCMEFYISKIQ